MAWAHVQTNGSRPGGADTTIVHTFAGAVAEGSLLVCFVDHSDSGGCTGVSDDVNGAWTEFPCGPSAGFTARQSSMWFFANSAAGTPVVTAALDASLAGRSLVCAEYSGIALSGPMDVSAEDSQQNPGTGTDAVTSGNTAVTAQANSLAICGTQVTTATVAVTAGTGFTQRYNAAGHGSEVIAMEDRNVAASGGAVAGTWTIDAALADSNTLVGVFKEPAAGGGNPWYQYMQERLAAQ